MHQYWKIAIIIEGVLISAIIITPIVLTLIKSKEEKFHEDWYDRYNKKKTD